VADVLRVEHLTKRYAGAALALDQVSFGVEQGTFLVLLGPSGSGKTTLVRSIAGIERISSGRIVIGDRVVADGRRHTLPEHRRLAMVFQDYALWPHLSARENVAFALRRHKASSTERHKKASAMLELVGLGHLGDRYPSELSGGEQQRVALARALVGESGIVLCDEPLSNLDADLRERMRVEVSSLVREAGATTVYITHDQAEAFALADRVGVLERGRLIQLDRPEEIYANPATPFVARFTGVAAELAVSLRRFAPKAGLVEVDLVRAQGLAPVVAEAIEDIPAGKALLFVRPAAASLCPPGATECHVFGKVADVAFRGRGYELAVDLDGGEQVGNVVASRRVERGETVGLRFGPGGCLLFGPRLAEPRDSDV
jgi:iron(III) transport system ATP-binding protein